MSIDTRPIDARPVNTSFEPVHPDTERAPYSTDAFRVRCPHCRKLYLVQYTDIQEAKPRFECVQCHSRFWLSLADMDLSSEIVGLPLQVKEAPVPVKPRAPVEIAGVKRETEPCPKCFKANEVHARECAHCGVMILKARTGGLDFDDSKLPARSPTLETAWNRVIDDYANENLHQDFVRTAQNEKNLPYAAAQYGQMQKLMPTDEITARRVREIQALGSALLPPLPDKPQKFMYARLWQIPLMGAAILIIVGMVLPMFRNIVGLGAAFLFLGIAMQIQLRRKG